MGRVDGLTGRFGLPKWTNSKKPSTSTNEGLPRKSDEQRTHILTSYFNALSCESIVTWQSLFWKKYIKNNPYVSNIRWNWKLQNSFSSSLFLIKAYVSKLGGKQNTEITLRNLFCLLINQKRKKNTKAQDFSKNSKKIQRPQNFRQIHYPLLWLQEKRPKNKSVIGGAAAISKVAIVTRIITIHFQMEFWDFFNS